MECVASEIRGEFGSGVWAGTHAFWPDDPRLREYGKLFVLFVIPAEEGTEDEVGNELLHRCNELFYGGSSGGSEGLAVLMERLVDEFPLVHGVVVTMQKEVLSLRKVGTCGVWGQMGEKGGWILSPDGTEIRGAVGKAKLGLQLVVGNTEFWKSVPPAKITEGGDIEPLIGTNGIGMTLEFPGAAATPHHSVENRHRPDTDEQTEEMAEPSGLTAAEVIPTARHMAFPRPKIQLPTRVLLKAKWRTVKGKLMLDEGEERPDWRKTGAIGAAFMVILAGVFLIGRAKRADEIRANSVEEKTIVQLVQDFGAAKALASLNRDQAKEQLQTLQVQLASLSETQQKDPRILELQNELGTVLGLATGKRALQLQDLANVGLARDGVELGDVRVDEKGTLWVLDTNQSRLFTVNVKTGAVEVVRGRTDIGQAKRIALYPGKVAAYSETGIIVCETGGACKEVAAKSDSWKEVKGLGMWAGNIYLLDPGAGQIWKYAVTDSGFGPVSDWIGTESGLNTSGGQDMAIDGFVWVVGGSIGSKVQKYVGGVSENFTISNLEGDLGQNLLIYTDENATNLYILDSDNSRVVVVTKEGEYVEQWTADAFKTARGLFVDEKGKKAYFAAGTHVWAAEF